METFYMNDKPLFTGSIESLEYEPNVSPLDFMNRRYLCNIKPEASVVLHVTNGILNDDVVKRMAKPKETIDPYTMTFNQRIIPNRKHHKKRIQKKWLKRYGHKTEEDVYKLKDISPTLSDSKIMNFNAELEFLERRIR